jgi:coronin-2
MSWHPQYRSSKFRHVFGKPASKENCYDSVPITRSVHDNHFCAVNPHFIAVVTECAGGGAFLVIPLNQVSTPGNPQALTEGKQEGFLVLDVIQALAVPMLVV